MKVVWGERGDEIVNGEVYLIDKIGVKEELWGRGRKGVVCMVKEMGMYGVGLKGKSYG